MATLPYENPVFASMKSFAYKYMHTKAKAHAVGCFIPFRNQKWEQQKEEEKANEHWTHAILTYMHIMCTLNVQVVSLLHRLNVQCCSRNAKAVLDNCEYCCILDSITYSWPYDLAIHCARSPSFHCVCTVYTECSNELLFDFTDCFLCCAVVPRSFTHEKMKMKMKTYNKLEIHDNYYEIRFQYVVISFLSCMRTVNKLILLPWVSTVYVLFRNKVSILIVDMRQTTFACSRMRETERLEFKYWHESYDEWNFKRKRVFFYNSSKILSLHFILIQVELALPILIHSSNIAIWPDLSFICNSVTMKVESHRIESND